VGGTFWATTRCCSGPLFGWEYLNGWDFLGHNLLLSQASLGGNPSMGGIF
jgi:hypothetical protein